MTGPGLSNLPALEARGVSKAFPGVVANADVDFAVWRGEVHALLGENGAGKSTLASILCGLYQPDRGQVLRDGRSVRLRSPRDGLATGIGMVHQHFRLVHSFTVADNVALGDRTQPRWLSTAAARRRVNQLAGRFGLALDPSAVVGDLSVGERQRVEIVKTLARGVEVLLLDEPTAVLTPQEIDALTDTVAAMARSGLAVVFITHKLREVMAVADRVTVMRDGRVVKETATEDTSPPELARMMVGREVDLAPQRRAPAQTAAGGPVIEVEDLWWGQPGDRGALRGVRLQVRPGEIVGIAGVAGNGQKPLAEVIAGLRPTSGHVRICGREATGRGPRWARANGLAYVPEDRLGTGLAPSLSVAENLLLTRPQTFVYRRRLANREARRVLAEFSVKAPGPETPLGQLSGGNTQKVLLARELPEGRAALLVASPTRGLDVGSVEFVRRLLLRQRGSGCGILLISEDLDEVRMLSDRILVLSAGRIVLERRADEADDTELGLAMAGEAV